MIWKGLDTAESYGNHYVFVPHLVRTLGIKSMVEVGVLRGTLSQRTLESCPDIEEYYMVDPWEVPEAHYDYKGAWARKPQGDWDRMFELASASVAQYECAEVVRLRSVTAALTFSDDHLDFVYIDAVHQYKEVMEDINAWLPKVKPDGFIGGDDFGQGKFPGVRKAVQDFFPLEIIRHGSPVHKWGYTWTVSKAEWLEHLATESSGRRSASAAQ